MSMSTLAFQNFQEAGQMAVRSKGKALGASKRLCQERFACTGDPAEFDCDECGTLQCVHCESRLHESPRFVFHDRRKIKLPPKIQMCGIHCRPAREAALRCEQCDVFMCQDCDAKMHSKGKRRTHERNIIQQSGVQSPPRSQVHHVPESERHGYGSDHDSTDIFQTCNFGIDDFVKPSSPVQSKSSPIAIPGKAAFITPTAVAMVTPQSSKAKLEKLDDGHAVHPSAVDAAMQPLDSEMKQISLDDDEDLYSPSLQSTVVGASPDGAKTLTEPGHEATVGGFLLVDDTETLMVKNGTDFLEALKCSDEAVVKVVSIFGNTGDGKSHTLNHTFYQGKEVFHTSASQDSCTIGVWAAYDPQLNVITVDTEGLLGTTPNQNQRMRLLLKVLAVSDIVIYRTAADRLHSDLYRFLGDASKAYEKHFTKELQAAAKRWEMDVPLSTLGPAVIVFHETTHTEPLGYGKSNKRPETQLKERFRQEGKNINAFSSLHYVGIRKQKKGTDFTGLRKVIQAQVTDSSVRSPRSPVIIYQALKVLNDKFNDTIKGEVPNTFPDEYFTCSAHCLSCNNRCTLTMNHMKDKIGHDSDKRCKYQHQYDNNVYTCKRCYVSGKETLVVPKTSASTDASWLGLAKYAWSGYVIECPRCGIIYRSREYWYGNKDPVDGAVRTEIRHVWPGGNPVLQGTHNAARRLLDGLSHVAGSVGYVSAKPTKMLSDWMTDQIAPAYWVPNNQITVCSNCKKDFAEKGLTKHHCRGCGQGFCNDCTSKRRAVPERGWGQALVRVCDECYQVDSNAGLNESTESGIDSEPHPVTARKVGEVIGSTLSVVASAIEYPKGIVVDAARPAYWIPDNQIKKCCCCKEEFGPKLTIHHCRACGDGVCNDCSPNTLPVPSRGWDHPVRICVNCEKADEL